MESRPADRWRRDDEPRRLDRCELARSLVVIGHVLVPLDGSVVAECALPFAAVVARAFDAEVTLLRVLEAHPTVNSHPDPLQWEMNLKAARNDLAKIAGEFRPRGTSPRCEVVSGDAAQQIIHYAQAEHVDLIVLSSHGEGGLSEWLLSSTVQKVILRAPTSVLVVPAYAWAGRRIGDLRLAKILLPLDCSPRAEYILPIATALAHVDAGELILAHVAPEPELPRHLFASAEDLTLAAQLTERNRHEAERYLAELQRQVVAGGTRARTRIVCSSRCDHALRALADQENVDLVLLCAHGRSGDAGERYGAVTTRLMQGGSRPVLVVQDLGGAPRTASPAEADRPRALGPLIAAYSLQPRNAPRAAGWTQAPLRNDDETCQRPACRAAPRLARARPRR